MIKLITNYFRSAAFWVVAGGFFAIFGIGNAIDGIWGKSYPLSGVRALSDLTSGSLFILVCFALFIVAIIVSRFIVIFKEDNHHGV